MVTELAILYIKPGAGAAFEAAFTSVESDLSGAIGYREHGLFAVLDQPDAYLLKVEWRDLSAHVDEFEPSVAHIRFMAALAPFLIREPCVIHVSGSVAARAVVPDAPSTAN